MINFIIATFVLFFASFNCCAECVLFNFNKNAENLNIKLIKKDDFIKTQNTSSVSLDDDSPSFYFYPTVQKDNYIKFCNLKRGKYLLLVEDSYANWDSSYTEIHEFDCDGITNNIDINLPTLKTDVSLKCELGDKKILVEVKRYKNGIIDNFFRQYRYFHLDENKKYSGSVNLNPGFYVFYYFYINKNGNKSNFIGSVLCHIKKYEKLSPAKMDMIIICYENK